MLQKAVEKDLTTGKTSKTKLIFITSVMHLVLRNS